MCCLFHVLGIVWRFFLLRQLGCSINKILWVMLFPLLSIPVFMCVVLGQCTHDVFVCMFVCGCVLYLEPLVSCLHSPWPSGKEIPFWGRGSVVLKYLSNLHPSQTVKHWRKYWLTQRTALCDLSQSFWQRAQWWQHILHYCPGEPGVQDILPFDLNGSTIPARWRDLTIMKSVINLCSGSLKAGGRGTCK